MAVFVGIIAILFPKCSVRPGALSLASPGVPGNCRKQYSVPGKLPGDTTLTYIIYWTKHSRNDPSAEMQGAAVTCCVPTGRCHDPALL